MQSPLRILSIEDDPTDAELIGDLLETAGLVCALTRVDTETAMRDFLAQAGADIILADYTLPSFDGLSALRVAKAICPEVPFLFVSGTLGEQAAIEALRSGATDYILKTGLAKLVPAVLRALREAREITDRKRADEKLRQSEMYLAEAQRLSHTGSFGWTVSTGEVYWSPETFRIFGYPVAAATTIETVVERTHPEDRPALQRLIERATQEKTEVDFEHRLLMPDNSVKHLHVIGRPSEESGVFLFLGAITDITERRQAEAALRRSERYLEGAQTLARSGSWAWNLRTNELFWSQGMFRILQYDSNTMQPTLPALWARVHPEDLPGLQERGQRESAPDYAGDPGSDFRVALPDGTIRHFHSISHPVRNEGGEVTEVWGTTLDVTEQRESRLALETAFEQIKALKDQLYDENIALREEINRSSMFEEIVGQSPALQAVLSHVLKVAPTDSTVLITGETGTGKELIARAIHKRSQRAARPFVSVNCAAIPPSLIASELFGHEKGAFTGAIQRRAGRFELAEGGSIFLDEIGELPPDVQIALLRVLQEREFERVGGTKVIRANVRVITATNRNLPAAIEGGAFRSDLYYRLNVFPIEMPPLRRRKQDIPILVEYFIDRYAKKAGKEINGISKGSLERLAGYDWPGNIRELQNVIERSVIVCETKTFAIDERWLTPKNDVAEAAAHAPLRMQPSAERKAIEAALADAQGRVSGPSGAAAKLGVPPSTLDSKIKLLKINKHRFKTV
jgi:PAS domain S-box-containing protein